MNVFVASEFSEPRSRPVYDRPADPAGLKEALRTLGGGVSVITAGVGAERSGATVTSATALSVDPPRMLVSLNRSSSTWPVVERYGHFAVNVIGADHQEVASQETDQQARPTRLYPRSHVGQIRPGPGPRRNGRGRRWGGVVAQ